MLYAVARHRAYAGAECLHGTSTFYILEAEIWHIAHTAVGLQLRAVQCTGLGTGTGAGTGVNDTDDRRSGHAAAPGRVET